MSLRHPQVEAVEARERQRRANEQQRDIEAKIAAAPPLTAKEAAALERALDRGWSRQSWLWTRACDKERIADSIRERHQLDECETVEAEDARWGHRFAMSGSEPLRHVVYPAEVGSRGRRIAGWD